MIPLLILVAACTHLAEPVDEIDEVDEAPDIQAVDPVPDAPAQVVIATVPDATPRRVAPVRPSDRVGGEVVVRNCYGRDLRQNQQAAAEGAADTATAAKGRATPPPPAANKPSPQPRPTPRPQRSTKPASAPTPTPADGATRGSDAGPRGGEGAGGGGLFGGLLSRGATAEEAPPAPDAEPMPTADRPAPARERREDKAKEAAGRDARSDSEVKRALQELGYVDGDVTDAEVMDEDLFAAVEETAADQARRVLDWGATVYLSNDDSMSLASAQRTLYALKRQLRVAPNEVRPHELLNYFSFDVAPVAEGRLFSVLGSAEQDGDTLGVSLAVRGANPERQPLDLTLALDRSCSMRQEGRMEYTKRGLTQLADNLQDGDRVDVVLFDSGVCTPLENFVVGRDDPELLELTISQLSPKGSTDLDGGLREAYRIQSARPAGEVAKRNQRVVLLTDAELNSGNVDEDLVSEVGKQFEERDIRLSGIGVGRTFNDTMLDKLTEKGKGAYVYLGSEAVVDRVFGPGFDSLTRTIAHDVQFSLELPDSLAMERFYGEEASTVAADVQPIHYYAGTTQLFLQDLAIREGRLILDDPVRMRIRYTDAATGEPAEEVLHTTIGALVDGDTHNLHKGQALMGFSDVVAAWAMRADPCGAPLSTYRQQAARVTGDAEIAYVSGLLGDLCGVDMTRMVPAGVAYKVKVDSDLPIAEVRLVCGGQRLSQRLSGADTVARFEQATPGECAVQLQGTVPMTAAVRVPETGGDVRCMVRAGRLSCS